MESTRQKLMVISHALVQEESQARWRKIADKISVCLVVPQRVVSKWFSVEKVFTGQSVKLDNFEVKAVKTSNETNFYLYFICKFSLLLKTLKPDIIYSVSENIQLLQTVVWRRLFLPKAKLVFFTMDLRARTSGSRNVSLRYLHSYIIERFVWCLVRGGTDAAVCHYPAIADRLRHDGYNKPILVQTQIGVDESAFYPDDSDGKSRRFTLGLAGFVVGFAGRITAEKGIFEIASAMLALPKDVHLLVVGDGPEKSELEARAKREGWGDRLTITGYVPIAEVPSLMRAMDCFVLGSRTTSTWTDTFPLVVAQAMATGIPVIGSSSGAIPYQLGQEGLVFDEGDSISLSKHIVTLYNNQELRNHIGKKLRERALQKFCVEGINHSFLKFLESI